MMKSRLLVLGSLLFGVLLLNSPSMAQTSSHIVSGGKGDTSAPNSDLTPDPNVETGMLSNGFRYVIMKNREPKDRVSMHLLVQVGSFYESEDEQGIAHFLEHMMFNGSQHFPPGELVKYFQLIGMQFGPDANAQTGYLNTVYDILLPKGDSKSVEQGLLVLKDYAQGALLTQDEIDKERGVILSEKRSRDSADYRTMVSSLQFEFPDARFSHRLPIGEESVIRSAGHDLMKRFYDTWYRPETMILVMVGDFDASAVEPLVKKAFGDMVARAPEAAEPDFGKIVHKGIETFYHHEPETGATSVSVEVVRKVTKKEDSKQLRRQDAILDIAEEMVQNRLDKMLSDPDVPFTSASIHMGRFLQQIKYAEISADCLPEKWEGALARIEQTLRQALSFGFTQSELDRVKKDYISSLENAVAQAPTRESMDLASEIIWHVENNRVFLSPEQEKTLLLPIINKLTPEEALEALQKAWAPDHRLVLVTGNVTLKTSGDMTPEKQIRSAFEHSEAETLKAPEESRQVVFPYLSKPASPGEISRRKEIKDLGIVQVDFKNGVRLNLKKTDFEADKIRVSIVFGGGTSIEPADKPGLAMLSEEVVNESGLGRLDKNELADALAGTQVEAGFDTSQDRFAFEGACASREIELLVQLLYAHLVDPGFRKDAFGLVMARFEQSYKSLSRDIDGGMSLEGKRFLAGGDSRFGMPHLEALKALTLADVQKWILAAINSGSVEVNVVGDMDTDAVINCMATYFGTLPEHKAPAETATHTSLSFPRGKKLDIRVDTQIPKGLVVTAYPTDDYWDISKTRRISVLADIFSEKLREKIREELGASYSPYAYNQSSRAYPGYGVLQAYVYVAPEQAAHVADVVRQIAGDIVANGVSDEDLERSLKPILTSIKDYRRTNTYWLDRVMADSTRHPQQLDWSRTFEKDYASITVQDIQKVAKAYLVNKNAACIIILPEEGK